MKKIALLTAIIALVAIGSFHLGNNFMVFKKEKSFSFELKKTEEFYKNQYLWPVTAEISMKAITSKMEFEHLAMKHKIANLLLDSGKYHPNFISDVVVDSKLSFKDQMESLIVKSTEYGFADGRRQGHEECFRTVAQYYDVPKEKTK